MNHVLGPEIAYETKVITYFGGSEELCSRQKIAHLSLTDIVRVVIYVKPVPAAGRNEGQSQEGC